MVKLNAEQFDADLDSLMDLIRCDILQLVATSKSQDRMLRKAAQEAFKETMQEIEGFVEFWT